MEDYTPILEQIEKKARLHQKNAKLWGEFAQRLQFAQPNKRLLLETLNESTTELGLNTNYLKKLLE